MFITLALKLVPRRGREFVPKAEGLHARLRPFLLIPFADGGPTTLDNLELRCPAHNAYEAEQWFAPRFARETGDAWPCLVWTKFPLSDTARGLSGATIDDKPPVTRAAHRLDHRVVVEAWQCLKDPESHTFTRGSAGESADRPTIHVREPPPDVRTGWARIVGFDDNLADLRQRNSCLSAIRCFHRHLTIDDRDNGQALWIEALPFGTSFAKSQRRAPEDVEQRTNKDGNHGEPEQHFRIHLTQAYTRRRRCLHQFPDSRYFQYDQSTFSPAEYRAAIRSAILAIASRSPSTLPRFVNTPTATSREG